MRGRCFPVPPFILLIFADTPPWKNEGKSFILRTKELITHGRRCHYVFMFTQQGSFAQVVGTSFPQINPFPETAKNHLVQTRVISI